MATIYSSSFETDYDGWVKSGNAGGFRDNSAGWARTGSWCVYHSSNDGNRATLSRTITGLTPGNWYTFSAWMQNGNGYGNPFGLALTGGPDEHIVNVVSTYSQVSAKFQATQTSHSLELVAAAASGAVVIDDVLVVDGQTAGVTAVITPPQPALPPVPNPSSESVLWDDFDGTSLPNYTTVGTVTISSGDSPGNITTADGRTGQTTHFLSVGAALDNHTASAARTVTIAAGGGSVEFWVRRQSESGYDFNKFSIDGAQQYSVSGINAWTKLTYPLSAGTHELKWTFTSDSSAAEGFSAQRITALTVTGLVVTAPPATPVNLTTDLRIEIETSTGVWTDITGKSKSASISRGDSEPGTCSVEVLDATLDPRTSASIRLGKPVRVRSKISGTFQSIYTGVLSNVEVDEDPLAPVGQRVNVKFTAVDNTALLANRTEDRGVATINELRWIVGTAVPFNINGQTTTLGTGTIVARNENASLWDQILVTRDSKLGYAWVDMDNKLNVFDSASMDTSSKAALTTSVYREIDVDFTLDQVINSVIVNWRRYNIGTETATDVPYGPYEDATSITNWGRRQATFTVQGATEVESQIAAFANDVLTRNKDAQVQARSVDIIIDNTTKLALTRNIELNSRVTVTHPNGTTVQTLRVIGINHNITPSRWTMTLELAKPIALTPPSSTPGTGISPIPPGSITDTELSPAVVSEIDNAYNTATAAATQAATAASTATTALSAANGKNKTWFSTSGPGTTANTVGDIWFQKDAATQTIINQWEGVGGTSWSQKTLANSVIANLDAGKITAGSAFTNSLSVKTNFTLGDAATNGVIQSYNFASSPVGVYMDKNGLVAKGGSITGATLTGGTFQTSSTGTSERIVIRNDGSGGIIEAFSGISGETATTIDPGALGGTRPQLVVQTGNTGTYANRGLMALFAGNDASSTEPSGAGFRAGQVVLTSDSTVLPMYFKCNAGGAYMLLSSGKEFWIDGAARVTGVLTATTGVVAGGVRILTPTTTASAANVFFDSAGNMLKSTSSRKYKTDIQPLDVDVETLLALEPKTFESKAENDEGRFAGFIAEDADDLGLEPWIVRDEDGEVDGFAYPAWTAAQQHILRAQQKRIDSLENTVADLAARLEALESK